MSVVLKERMSLAEFAPYAEDGLYELDDGELLEREMSNKTVLVGVAIYELLAEYSRRTNAGKALPDGIAYRCFPDQVDRVRKPDVSWFSVDRWNAEYSEAPFVEIAPDLMVEVVSPNDNSYKLSKKVDQFLRSGTKEAWIVHPHIEKVERRYADGAARWYGADEGLDAAPLIPGFKWKLSDVLAKA